MAVKDAEDIGRVDGTTVEATANSGENVDRSDSETGLEGGLLRGVHQVTFSLDSPVVFLLHEFKACRVRGTGGRLPANEFPSWSANELELSFCDDLVDAISRSLEAPRTTGTRGGTRAGRRLPG